ncbi:MAG: leucine-rich repeat protein [Lachnospiraceae bacterium]|nr:leucine-rich repeat protein [Lachnospiraceae bacterium]
MSFRRNTALFMTMVLILISLFSGDYSLIVQASDDDEVDIAVEDNVNDSETDQKQDESSYVESDVYDMPTEIDNEEENDIEWEDISQYAEITDRGAVYGYKGKCSHLVIPEEIDGIKVRELASYIFKGHEELVAVKLPEGLVEIGRYAFMNAGLGMYDEPGTIEIPSTVNRIEFEAFRGCKYLGNVVFRDSSEENPSGINFTYDSDYAYTFAECPMLERIKLSNRCTKLPSRFAYNDFKLKEVVWSGSLTTLAVEVFANDKSLQGCDLSGTQLTGIGKSAFSGCTNLNTPVFPETLTGIGYRAFYGDALGGDGQTNCVVIPESVNGIGREAFYCCTELEEVRFCDSTVKGEPVTLNLQEGIFESYTFANCPKLRKIYLSNRCKEIPICFACDNPNLEEVVWPYTMVAIYRNAFQNDNALRGLDLSHTRLSSIGDSAFEGCSSIATVVMPSALEKVGKNVFMGDASISSCDLSQTNLLTIGTHMFQDCVSLNHVEFSATLERIDQSAFMGCTALEVPVFPETLNQIDSTAFSNAFLGKGEQGGILVIPSSVKTIGAGAFNNCDGIYKVCFNGSQLQPGSVTVGYNCFANCDGLKCIMLSDGISDISVGFAANCPILTKIIIPSSVKTINRGAFTVEVLTDTYVVGDNTVIDDYNWLGDNRKLIKKPFPMIPVTGVTLDKETISLENGDTAQLSAVISPTDASDNSLIWESSNPEVASVDDRGMISANNTGTATIIVTTFDGDFQDVCVVTVTSPLKGVELNSEMVELTVGDQVELRWWSKPVKADDTTFEYSLIEEQPKVSGEAVIDFVETDVKNGRLIIRGKSEGTITVRLSAADTKNMFYKDCVITVKGLRNSLPMCPAPEISDRTTELHLVKGQKFTLPDQGWISERSSTVSISKKGLLTAKKITDTPVRITKGNRSIDIYVSLPTMTAKSLTLEAGKIQQIMFDYDSDNLNVLWFSSAPDVATISQDGFVTARSKGNTTIKAYINGKAYTCKLKVKESIVATERNMHLMVNSSKTISLKGVKKPVWTVSDGTIVKVKGSKFTGLKAGETTLTTENGGKVYIIHLYVEDPTIKSGCTIVGKNKYTVAMKTGSELPLEYNYIEQNIVFKSGKGEYAYYDDGRIVARKAGKTKLTAKVNGKTITISVIVQ